MCNWIFYFYLFLHVIYSRYCAWLCLNYFAGLIQPLFFCSVFVSLFGCSHFILSCPPPFPLPSRSVSRPKLKLPTMCSWNSLLKIPTHCECCVPCHLSGLGSGAIRTSPLSLITLRNSTLILPSGQCIIRKK